MRAVAAVVVAGDVMLWNRPIVGALSSFLNVSAEANNCGSIIRQPTLLAALLAGINAVGFGTFASGGKGNICAGGIFVGPIVEMGPKSGLFNGCTGGNCTVGNDGTGNTSAPAVAVTAGVPPQLLVSAATEAAVAAALLLLGAMQLIAAELLGEKAAEAAATETIAVSGKCAGSGLCVDGTAVTVVFVIVLHTAGGMVATVVCDVGGGGGGGGGAAAAAGVCTVVLVGIVAVALNFISSSDEELLAVALVNT